MSAPAVGSILLNTESKSVAGRLLAVENVGGQLIVTLGLVSVPELLPNLSVNEVLDLSRAPVTFPPDLAAAYDIVRDGNTFTFTPKNTAQGGIGRAAAAPIGTTALGPFSCESSLTGVGTTLPIQLSVPPLFSVTFNPSLDLVYTPGIGLERFVINGEPAVKVEGGFTIAAAFEGKIECKLRLFDLIYPIFGPVWAVLPVGAGAELSGKFTVASMGLKTQVEAKARARLGVACLPGGSCGLVNQLDNFVLSVTPTVDLSPNIGDLRVEPGLSLFGTVDVEIGPPVLSSLRFNAAKAKAGGKIQGNFAPKATQIADAGYKSDYKVSLEASAGPGTGITGAINLLGVSIGSPLELTISTDLAKSPTGAVTADRATFVAGDTVNLTVKLDPATVNFLGFYNVNRVLFVRNSGGSQPVVGTVNATAGQTDFSFAFTAPGPGVASEFYAFVVTTILNFDILSLEVGNAVPFFVSISPQNVTLAQGGTQQFTATVTGSANTAVTWTRSCGTVNGTGLYTAPSTVGTCTVTATSVEDPTRSATATVTVQAIVVAISPPSASLAPGGSQQFSATVTGTTNTAVTWTATCGQVDANGLYTAPAAPATCTVTATSAADATASATAAIQVGLGSSAGFRPALARVLGRRRRPVVRCLAPSDRGVRRNQ